ncbi:MAG: hypothetical protein AAF236_05615 [Verrucomicrobiota bacterium]
MSIETKNAVEACSTCAYWKSTNDSTGSCRRQPPQAIRFEVDQEVQFETRFPSTSADDWCGEFRAS